MKLSSPAFQPQGLIPQEFTCEGKDQPPPLEISDIPAKTKTFALIVEDPDAPNGPFTHWVLYNFPANQKHIDEKIGKQGMNHFGKKGYGGPCPPSGTHRYFFKLFALDTELNIPEKDATKERVLTDIQGHILAEAQLVGVYQKTISALEKKKKDQKVEEASIESFPASDPPAY